ncbi:MAG TPA: Gfo/Idh/MocA family oxidoreductase [Spirochaetales bacterium]|nr:Gfo/Idh/MocA family oxidoreductase [Spirochaetales bacterium]HPG85379.1 Gfo/Idh/MocA family oxidoreductase [Spirochaetales bacterium]HPM71596.1 Gfo/Idh/MocA family oxidoreductase [Spirochaetales bacterium]
MRLGIAGSGMIVEDGLRAISEAKGVTAVAICAREKSRDRAEALAARHGVGSTVYDYDELLGRADVDAVYIALVNDLHYDYAKRALEAGKHAIVEKPFTVTLAEAEALVALARSRGLFLFEAAPTVHMPLFRSIVERAAGIGRIGLVQCSYCQRSSRYDRYLAGDVAPAFDPAHAGGALRDLNVYNLHLAVRLLGLPNTASYSARRGWNGVDTSGSALLGYGGASATCVAAKDADGPGFSLVIGESGWIRADGSPNALSRVEYGAPGLGIAELRDDSGLPRLAHEWIAFERMMREGRLDECYDLLEHSLRVMKVLDSLSRGL